MASNDNALDDIFIEEDHEDKQVFEVGDFHTDEDGLTRMSFYIGDTYEDTTGVVFGLEKTKQIRDYLNKIIERQEAPSEE